MATLVVARDISHVSLLRIQRVLSGSLSPSFWPEGRSAWLNSEDGWLKIKGLGLRDSEGHSHFPSTKHYFRLHDHLGFASDGTFVSIKSEPCPEGGILLRRAVAEFSVAATLAAHGCPVAAPLAVFQFDPGQISYTAPEAETSEALGVVVLGAPTRTRLNEQVRSGNGASIDSICVWANAYGSTIRRFHQAGFYRYSGHLNNALVTAEGEVTLVDLDSSRPCVELHPSIVPLYLARDVASVQYGFLCDLTRPEGVLVDSSEDLASILLAVLTGYKGSPPSSSRGRQWLKQILSKVVLSNKTVPTSAEPERSDFQCSRRRRFLQSWLDRRGAYACLLSLNLLQLSLRERSVEGDDWLVRMCCDWAGHQVRDNIVALLATH